MRPPPPPQLLPYEAAGDRLARERQLRRETPESELGVASCAVFTFAVACVLIDLTLAGMRGEPSSLSVLALAMGFAGGFPLAVGGLMEKGCRPRFAIVALGLHVGLIPPLALLLLHFTGG